MTRPADVGSFGELVYERLAPIAYADEELGWPLLVFCGGIGKMFQLVHDVAADTDEVAGWSTLFDVETCPAQFLPYLAQYVGARIPVGTLEDTARDMVRTPAGHRRGTPAAMTAAAQRTLTDLKYVRLIERNESPYALTVVTRTSETPDPDLTLAALMSEKPIGLVLTHVVSDVEIVDGLIGDTDSLAGDTDDL